MYGSNGENLVLTSFGSLVNLIFHINGNILNLGVLYYVYMSCLVIFTTNAINIYAGINGLEAGQSFIIGVTILTMNMYELCMNSGGDTNPNVENHLFSAVVMIPFVGVTLGLLKHNWYPSSVFVGDTFCYFAGMTFGVVAILGHFSKSLLLFFVPQLINFVYSIPQLAPSRLSFSVPCPRHRLPTYNPSTGLIEPSRIPTDVYPGNHANMTLINLFLRIFGPMHEEKLCFSLLIFQVICCALGLVIRYQFVDYLFDSQGKNN